MRSTILIVILLGGLLLTAGATAADGVCITAEDVAQLPARHWCEVPNSKLRSVEKRPAEYDDWDGSSSAKFNSFQRVMGVGGVTRAWNGAAFDTKRNCLLVTGGGHNDYGGNEVYRFCLGNLQWDRLTNPTVFPNRHPEFQNPDRTPISRHTYGGLVYLPGPDRFFVFDGAPDYGPGACGTRGTWTLDLAARDAAGAYAPSQWELRTADNEPDRGCDNAATYDPISENVIFKSAGGTHTYDFSTNSWSRASNAGRRNERVSLAVDSERRMLVEVGGGITALWSIDNGFTGGVVSTSGGASIEGADDPGLAYDIRLGKIVAWRGGASVYTFDVASRTWATIAPAATNVADPGSITTSGGVFGRFSYSPALNVFMYVGRVDSNVMLYRLGDGEPLVAPRPPSDLVPQ